MTLLMPAPEPEIMSRRNEVIARLRAILPRESLIVDEVARRAYECDAFTMYRALPLVVALPESVEEVRAVMALAAEMNVKLVPRGAGTSLSGGSMPLEDGILLGIAFSKSTMKTAARASSPASRTWRSRKPSRRRASTTRRILRRRSPVRSAAMSPRTPAAFTA